MVPRLQRMSDPAEPADAADLAAALLLAYLQGHPHAADSLEGVARWWLGDDGRFSPAEVERALERLVAAGHLRREVLADGRTLYAAARPDRATPRRPAAGRASRPPRRPPHLH